MKFTDGFWLIRKGYEPHYPAQAYYVVKKNGALKIFAPCKYVAGKGDTMNHSALTIKLSSPMPGIVHINVRHYSGGFESKGFELADCPDWIPEIDDAQDSVTLTSGNLSVRVTKDPWSMDFFCNGQKITGSGFRHTAYFRDDKGNPFVREQLDIDVDECVYGLGERFTNFVKNGQIVDMWNADGGTCSEQAYKNVPFYVTNKGYGVFVNHTGNVSFEVASEVVSRVQFSVPGEELDYFVIAGPSIKDVLRRYTALTGRPALPPAWSFGLWLTTSFTTSYDEKTVMSFVDGMAERDIPLSVFHFDCFWMKEFHLCDFEWDERVFPDPESMLKRLKAKGLHICVWLNSYVAQDTEMFEEGKRNGYFIKNADGTVWQWDMWEPGMAIVDFTNPAACEWYSGKLRKLMDMGVDCFKTDFGERIPTDGVVYFDGSNPIEMHNYYTYLYQKVVFETLRQKGDAVLFARAATAGAQKFPVHWGGDCTAAYSSMAESLRGGLSLSMCGFGFWSHDIGGFENTATPDLYKRWVAFGLLSTHSRLHGSSSYRVPWLFDEEAVEVVRFFTKLKCTLMPYIYKTAVEAAREGVPSMRAMVMEFDSDPVCASLDLQYMLGDSLLVAPIFNDRGEASYYLPAGRWINYLTGELVEGGSFRKEKHDYMSVPLFVRPNSMIAVGSVDTKPDYDYADGVKIFISCLDDGATAKTTVYGIGGMAELEISATCAGGSVLIEASGTGKSWTAFLAGITDAKSAEGAEISVQGNGISVTPKVMTGKIKINL